MKIGQRSSIFTKRWPTLDDICRAVAQLSQHRSNLGRRLAPGPTLTVGPDARARLHFCDNGICSNRRTFGVCTYLVGISASCKSKKCALSMSALVQCRVAAMLGSKWWCRDGWGGRKQPLHVRCKLMEPVLGHRRRRKLSKLCLHPSA